MAGPRESKGPGPQALATNRQARRDFHILEQLEAGIELQGTEVKSIRAGKASLAQSYARVEGDEVILHGLHVEPYAHGNRFNHDPVRPRRLLLHRQELRRLHGQVAVKGQTLVPLRLYLKRGRVKVELGLGKGKHDRDKRETLKRRTADREAQRAIADRIRR